MTRYMNYLKNNILVNSIVRLMLKILVVILLAYLLFQYVFGLMIVKTNHMSPAINAGDGVLYYRLTDRYHINDVVVYEIDNTLKVGRIVAQGDDEVNFTEDGGLLVNGHPPEKEVPYLTYPHSSGPNFPYKVPKNTYFILNDYREERLDSRYYGALPINQIKGKISTLLRVRGI
ncbi:signal peptidase I [Streptococcus dysgalactiae]|uniref:Signal peptidase I n=2 Tax=Streptococcus dysgalactiae subsp. equisimilis TaxID=119602 RepID=A0AAE9U1Q2_STREQ|nr:signal peptidase I [Streptococcus dysgalactiae]BAH82263.1 signal peptidase I [Streptococcus dysgalactiae subsp. equisimilis GGS_124]QQY17890.1 signal peptidase I [Streptococcus dysgalactiae]TYK95347.1 signal peptidase I [Streptococcus dysgalactiae]WEQ81082.1 signal peptidase I SipA [Streptococcus dysgalactiae subsp. equisimilis]VTT17161.1 signal peptidase I [Streptococcus dysgalactiae]